MTDTSRYTRCHHLPPLISLSVLGVGVASTFFCHKLRHPSAGLYLSLGDNVTGLNASRFLV